MKNIRVLILALLVAPIIAFGQQEMNPRPFHGVDVSGGITTKLIKSKANRLVVTVEKGEYSDLDIEVDDGILEISKKKGSMWKSKKIKAHVDIYYTTLDVLDASSGSSIYADDAIESDEMSIDASSGASIDVGILAAGLEVDASSGASISISGKTKLLTVDGSSGSVFNGEDLSTDHATLDASSGASIKVRVVKTLRADASSGGVIKYKGQPEILEMDQNMGSSIKQI